jgi:hypothetical protein
MRRIFLYLLFYSLYFVTYKWFGFEIAVLSALGTIVGQLTYDEGKWEK